MRRIVCAANMDATGQIVLGARHHDTLMNEAIRKLPSYTTPWKQGFIDQFGVFVDRQDAHRIATEADQIIRRCGGDENTLYSENLY
jgi:hypothetical protein